MSHTHTSLRHPSRLGVCLALLLIAAGATAQGSKDPAVEIVSVELTETSATQARLDILLRNHRGRAFTVPVRAILPADELGTQIGFQEVEIRAMATERISFAFGTGGYVRSRPILGEVVAENPRREERDRETFTLPAREATPATPVFSNRIGDRPLTLAPPTVSEVALRIVTGSDDRRPNTRVCVSILPKVGSSPLTGDAASSCVFIASWGEPTWASGQAKEFTIPLRAPTEVDRIGRALIRVWPDAGTTGTDNWDVDLVEVRAAGQLIGVARGRPFHRFGPGHPETRVVQIQAVEPDDPVEFVELLLFSGDDGVRAGSQVRFRVLDREGRPLTAQIEDPRLTREGLPSWRASFVSIPVSRTTADRIGSVEIIHESVRSGLLDGDDDWTLTAAEVTFSTERAVVPQQWMQSRVARTSSGTPLHRFEGANRRFVLRIF